MGLDMYLKRKIYIGAQYHSNISGDLNIYKDGNKLPISLDTVQYIEQEVGYWRKANAIHNFFVNNVQEGVDDCKDYYVSDDDLEELLRRCKKIKEESVLEKGKVRNGETYNKDTGEWEDVLEEGFNIKNPEIAKELLPVKEGFFFGGTDYDEYYMYDIEHTIEILENVIKENNELNKLGFYTDIYYTASW